MTYSARHVESFISIAEHKEIIESELTLAYELAKILNVENIKRGVEIDFGEQKSSFENTIKLLRLDQHAGRDLELMSAAASSRMSVGFVAMDTIRESVDALGLAGTLELLQSREWSTRSNQGGWSTEPSFPESVYARLRLGKLTSVVDGTQYVNTGYLGIDLIQSTAYEPTFYDEYGNLSSYENEIDSGIKKGKIFREIMRLVVNEGGSFRMPGTGYSLKVSELYEEYSRELITRERFTLEDGKIIRYVDPTMSNEDDQGPVS